jgi:soluble lytic murein transglycosylase
MPFLEEVKSASSKFKISSSFIYSIMRQESAFDPEARSWADAFGLLQLLPKLAKGLSKRAGVQVASYTDLYHPETNIKLGARHLKDLQKRKKNKFVLYVSSYNASEKAVSHWMKTRFKGNYIEFIERIPYKETRDYVKLVLRNYFNYKRGLSNIPFSFPENFFISSLN